MEIKIQLKKYVLCICFGYKTDWFGQMSFLTITKEYYVNHEVDWAELIYRS